MFTTLFAAILGAIHIYAPPADTPTTGAVSASPSIPKHLVKGLQVDFLPAEDRLDTFTGATSPAPVVLHATGQVSVSRRPATAARSITDTGLAVS
ncbi:hypothetical protein MMYC01_204786 [Madurella mycetomatis]|uniref:Uncharacterized protein n=1 Tax=Madurella mycetomatis TaxID=100816 RepID=A0A175W1Z9_9PEZI|nr:hypothetical protein MMYC01_204786 [Madurella mycetomatis]